VTVSLSWIGAPWREAGVFPLEFRVALRRINMRPPGGFVNSDPTRYCAFLLGQSQEVVEKLAARADWLAEP
jgi:hypothetical protein